MNSYLGGLLDDLLLVRVRSTAANFEGAKRKVATGDILVGPAPEILGKLFATKQALLEENKLPETSLHKKEENLLLMLLLDCCIKLHLRALAPNPAVATFVRACVDGSIIVPRVNAYLICEE